MTPEMVEYYAHRFVSVLPSFAALALRKSLNVLYVPTLIELFPLINPKDYSRLLRMIEESPHKEEEEE